MTKEVEVDRRQTGEVAPSIPRERDGLQEHLGKDDCRSAIDVDTVGEARNGGDEVAEVAEAAFPQGSARRLGMHVSNVGPDRNVHRKWNPESPGSRCDAEPRIARVLLREEAAH